MIIKSISCTQFAGVRDRNVALTDGINVIFGKNESGKSTLVNLLSRTLFQNAKLDRRSDKDFFEHYFPAARKGGGAVGDFADGKITLETADGTYTLSKEWGADARAVLSTPDGIIRDPNTIDAVLKTILLYGEGVYADMLFSSQRNTDLSLQALLDASKKTDAKQEIVSAVSKAFAQSDGIPLDAIEQAILQKIDEIAGKHWDAERHAPVRKAGRWSTGLGEILKAYYAMEDAQAVLTDISRLEADADRTAADYVKADADAAEADAAHTAFNRFAGRLALQSERKKTIARLENELQKITELLAVWPNAEAALNAAKALQNETTDREVIDTYEAVTALVHEKQALVDAVSDRPCPTADEIAAVKAAARTVVTLENRLCGMNLHAALTMLGNHKAEVTSVRTGEPIDLSDGAITEAVIITVPDVMTLRLAPADVDCEAIEATLTAQRQHMDAVFATYGVDSVDALEALARSVADTKAAIAAADNRLTMRLGSTTVEALTAARAAIDAPVRDKEAIDADIRRLIGNTDLVRFITAKETVLDGYIAEYGSVNELKAHAFDLSGELSAAKTAMADTEDIPEAYRTIPDPEAHLSRLQTDLKETLARREEALTAKTAAAGRLEAYKSTLPGDPVTDAKNAERRFSEQQELFSHWLHIADVFRQRKDAVQNNPMQDIADRFLQYLGTITGGTVSSEFPDADKLNLRIYSDNRLLDYGKLSEGTKETVSLAFRLAVLDHLFPDGGGVIVFDDPFTDMDIDRMTAACELLKTCAMRHQVIFLTCREEYVDRLNGHTIRF